MAENCQFAGFIEEGKVCQHPPFQDSEYCYWHDPGIPKSEEFVRSALENVIKASGGDLEGYVLKQANLSGMNLAGVNLKDADLTGTNCDGANFDGGDLRGVKMNNASAIGANFENANLMTANLSSGNFTNANFKNTNFRIVLVENSIMDGAHFDGSDRRHTTMFMGMPASAEATGQVSAADAQPTSAVHTAETIMDADDYSASPTVLNADFQNEDAPLFSDDEIIGEAQPQTPPTMQPQAQPAMQPQTQPTMQPQAQPAMQPQAQPQQQVVGGGGMSIAKIGVIAASVTVGAVVVLFLILTMLKPGDPNTKKPADTGTATAEQPVKKTKKLSQRMADLEKKVENSVLLNKSDLSDTVMIERVQEALKIQKKIEEELIVARKESGNLKEKIEVDKAGFEKMLVTFKEKLDLTLTVKKDIEDKLAKTINEVESIQKEARDTELSLSKQITALEKKLKDTEKEMNSTEGEKTNFAEIVKVLRETNDEMVKSYEKKMEVYEAKIAKLSQWYQKDKEYTEDKFNRFLVNWERYTVVGSPFSDYVVGVKFTKLANKKVRSNIFILGVEGASQPAFQIVAFDAEGEKINGDMKTMMSQTISKGNIFTAKREFELDEKPLRYFTVQFVQ